MKKLTAIILLLFFSLDATAQLEVKPDSFKEVAGFVNINLDIQEDDNNVPYAVVKVKTENINDKQRRELLFQGDAATFIECEYQSWRGVGLSHLQSHISQDLASRPELDRVLVSLRHGAEKRL